MGRLEHGVGWERWVDGADVAAWTKVEDVEIAALQESTITGSGESAAQEWNVMLEVDDRAERRSLGPWS